MNKDYRLRAVTRVHRRIDVRHSRVLSIADVSRKIGSLSAV
jgi:hypothetical protein